MAIFSSFSAIMHGIGTVQGGNTVVRHAMSRRRSMVGSETCWFSRKHLWH